MNERERGYYWIKQSADCEWEAAHYCGGVWYLTGSEIGYEEDKDSWFPITIHACRRIHRPIGG